MAADLRRTIAANLLAFERVSSDRPQTPAAVAIVVLENGGAPCVPIFQRTSDMRRHAGQMALPGGRLHDRESVEDCARRELREELWLDVGPDAIAGLLDDFDTRSGFTITPVVMFARAEVAALRPSKFEVARLFPVPLPDIQSAASRASPGPAPGFSLKLEWVEVFAPTAAILYQFNEVALQGRPVRVGDFYQPPFTHR